jgi:hypothetical protein
MTRPLPERAGRTEGGCISSTTAEISETLAALRGAHPALAARPRAEVIAILSALVDDWLAPDSAWFARAVALLPAVSGFSAPMIRRALPTMLEPLRTPALEELLRREAGDRRGPPIILHVLPGNLPGLAAIPAALSLAVGSTALLKPGRGDRTFPALFIASLAARDPALAACLAAPYWPGGDRACEDVALGGADLVVAAGDDATIDDLAGRARGRFIGHGHRISFALVTAAMAAAPDCAAALAADTAIWDQRGCLSPQMCFVEGDRDAATVFAARVADELARLAAALPPGRLGLGDRLRIRRFRDESEWALFDGERATVFALADEAAGTVVVEPRPAFRPSPLGRSLRIMPIASCADLDDLLKPVRDVLEGAGLAAEAERWSALADRLRAAGVHLVSRLGAMQRPPLDWRQGGRPRLADWLDGDGS